MADLGILEGFNSGSDTAAKGTAMGMEYAKNVAQLDMQRQTLEQKQTELSQQKQQRDYEQGKWVMEQIQTIASKPPTKYKNTLINSFNDGLQTMGFKKNEALSSLLVDEDYANEVNQAMAIYQEMPPEMRAEWLPKITEFITSGDPAAMLQQFNAQGFEIRKMNEKAKLDATTEKLKADLAKPMATTELTMNTQKELRATPEFKEYSAINNFFDTIKSATDKPTKFRDLSAMFAFMKLLDPTSVVRESEGKLFIQTGSAYEGIAQSLTKMWNGESLSQDKRQELFGIAAEQLDQYKGRYQTVAADTIQAAVEGGANPKLVDPAAKLIKKNETVLSAYRAQAKRKQDELASAVNDKQTNKVVGYDAETVGIIKKLQAKGKSRAAIESMVGRPIPEDLAKSLNLR